MNLDTFVANLVKKKIRMSFIQFSLLSSQQPFNRYIRRGVWNKVLSCSVTSQKWPNVHRSCLKTILLVKWKILTNLQKMPKMCCHFGQINCCHQLWKVAQSPINYQIWSHCSLVSLIPWTKTLSRLYRAWRWRWSFRDCRGWWRSTWGRPTCERRVAGCIPRTWGLCRRCRRWTGRSLWTTADLRRELEILST